MDHETVEKTSAVERYLLNDVTSEERAEIEAHFFQCPNCAERIREGAIFIDAAKEELRNEETADPAANRRAARGLSWRAWLMPTSLIPSLAALALAIVVGYQNLVTLPALEEPQILSSAVIAPPAREELPSVTIDRGRPHFNLNFMVDSPRVYHTYLCRFTKENGHAIVILDAGPLDVSSFTLSFLLSPAQFPDGRYELTLSPRQDPGVVVQRYTFLVHTGASK